MKAGAWSGLACAVVALGVALPWLGAAGCSSSSATAPSVEAAADASDRTCAIGTITQPDQSCAAGDFAVVCANGFAADPSGYGCRDVLPADPCVGATRAALGSATCVPVGDCNAAFPPSGATLFVNASGAVDATHFKTISAAVAAAAPGAIIAVDSGTYAEAVAITQAVSIIGKCAADVIIDGKNGNTVRGIFVNGAAGVSVSGVTIRGQFIGVSVAPNGVLDLSHAILDSNIGVGLALQDGNGTATLDDVVIRNTQGDSEPGFGINAQSFSHVTMSNTELTGNHDAAFRVASSSTAAVSQSVFSNTTPFTGEPFGRGLVVQSGGSADVRSSAFVNNEEIAIVLQDSTSTFSQIVVRDTHAVPSGDFGRGIDAFDNGNFTLDSSTLSGNADASIIVVNATASITKSVIQNTLLDGTGSFGRGLTIQEGAKVTLDGSAIVGSHESAIAVFSNASTLGVTKSFIAGTLFNADSSIAYGIVSIQGPGVTIAHSEIDSCAGAGLGFSGAGGIVSSSVIAHNGIGIATTPDLTLEQVDVAPTQVDLTVVAVTSNTTFVANQTRVTSGNIPIPTALTAAN